MTKLKKFEFRPAIKELSSRRRHLGVKAIDRVALKSLEGMICDLLVIRHISKKSSNQISRSSMDALENSIKFLLRKVNEIILPPAELHAKLPPVIDLHRTIDSFRDEEIPNNFRFRSKSQLSKLIRCFQMPELLRSTQGHVFKSEELLLVTLFRFHCPCITTDATFKQIFGWTDWKVSMGVKLFVEYIIMNWSYLIEDNAAYWVDFFPMFAECIQKKLIEYGCNFLPSNQIGGFKVFGFIDNTVFPTSRPGGGPVQDGVGSPRNHPLLQRSFYNGWKSLHGIKFQTIALPNGMMFHVWGPASCRHNDNYTLQHSNIQQVLSNIQLNQPLKYVVYGDSAYWSDEFIKSRHRDEEMCDTKKLENASMSKCRQTVEWDYGLVGSLWKRIFFKKNLKLREQSVCNMTLFCMLITNAYVTMNGSQSSVFFTCMPPSLEEWTSQGPRRANIVEFWDHTI